ncbi:MAG TPA: copper chaperone [Caldithrix sp.]|nr:copper chaperone [Caldithrix sp.]
MFRIKVPDMSCDNCKMAITRALAGVDQIEKLEIDLDSKLVTVTGSLDLSTVLQQISMAGYTPELL